MSKILESAKVDPSSGYNYAVRAGAEGNTSRGFRKLFWMLITISAIIGFATIPSVNAFPLMNAAR
jgi:hypothetical protein